MNIIQITPELYLIPLDQKLPGFTSFISAWLYKGEKTFLIDTGPSATIPHLLKGLEKLHVRQLDAVFLTHIHIDHAGGVGDIVFKFPDTPVICHESGIRHLCNPDRLWEGSLKTLGKIAQAYGKIRPVPSDLLYDAQQFQEYGVESFLTPGHAPHHVSYQFQKYLFAGEAGGVFLQIENRKSKIENNWYLRPATPPKFFLETSIKSIEILMTIPHQFICYGHFGATIETPRILEIHKNQLFLWADMIREQMKSYQGTELEEECMAVLLAKDPSLRAWKHLKPEIRERERYFLRNSIRGFIGYL